MKLSHRARSEQLLIEARGLRRLFTATTGREIIAVNGVDIELNAGEILGILGPNGAGKTTLLRMLAGIISPTSGELKILGRNLTQHRRDVRRAVGFVSSNTHLYGRLTPREHLVMFGQLFGMSASDIRVRAEELIERLGLASFVDRRVEHLATGQIQRASLARALIHAPRILILDEPTAGLDILGADAVLDLIRGFGDQNGGVILSTHQLTEAELVCQRMSLMLGGQLLMSGALSDLQKQSETGLLKDLFRQLANQPPEQMEDQSA